MKSFNIFQHFFNISFNISSILYSKQKYNIVHRLLDSDCTRPEPPPPAVAVPAVPALPAPEKAALCRDLRNSMSVMSCRCKKHQTTSD